MLVTHCGFNVNKGLENTSQQTISEQTGITVRLIQNKDEN